MNWQAMCLVQRLNVITQSMFFAHCPSKGQKHQENQGVGARSFSRKLGGLDRGWPGLKGLLGGGRHFFFLFNTTLSTRRMCLNDINMPPTARKPSSALVTPDLNPQFPTNCLLMFLTVSFKGTTRLELLYGGIDGKD